MQTTESRESFVDGSAITKSGTLRGVAGFGLTPPVNYSTYPGIPDFETTRLRSSYEERTQQSGDQRSTWNPFEHYRLDGSYPRTLYDLATRQFVSQGFPFYGHVLRYDDPRIVWPVNMWGPPDRPLGLLALYEAKSDGHFIKVPATIPTLCAHAQKVMLGQNRPKTSLLNSVYELKDFRSLPQQIARLRRSLKDTSTYANSLSELYYKLPKWQRKLTRFKLVRGTLQRVLRHSAEMFLQWNFNIAPLISDVENCYSALAEVREKIRKALLNDGVLRTVHFNASLGAEYPSISEEIPESAYTDTNANALKPRYIQGVHRCQRRLEYTKASFHAQMELCQTWSGWQKQNALLLGLCDQLGVRFDPSIIWNAIPFSFLVDWVINVNRWLEQFSRNSMEPATLVYQWCWSMHVKRTYTGIVNPGIDLSFAQAPAMTAVVLSEEAFKRDTTYYDPYAALSGSGISLKEFSLGSALVLSRHRASLAAARVLTPRFK